MYSTTSPIAFATFAGGLVLGGLITAAATGVFFVPSEPNRNAEAAGAMVTAAAPGTAVSTAGAAPTETTSDREPLACDQRAWPYRGERCGGTEGSRDVRVISTDRIALPKSKEPHGTAAVKHESPQVATPPAATPTTPTTAAKPTLPTVSTSPPVATASSPSPAPQPASAATTVGQKPAQPRPTSGPADKPTQEPRTQRTETAETLPPPPAPTITGTTGEPARKADRRRNDQKQTTPSRTRVAEPTRTEQGPARRTIQVEAEPGGSERGRTYVLPSGRRIVLYGTHRGVEVEYDSGAGPARRVALPDADDED